MLSFLSPPPRFGSVATVTEKFLSCTVQHSRQMHARIPPGDLTHDLVCIASVIATHFTHLLTADGARTCVSASVLPVHGVQR